MTLVQPQSHRNPSCHSEALQYQVVFQFLQLPTDTNDTQLTTNFDPVNMNPASKLLDAQSRRNVESVDVFKEKLAHAEGWGIL